MHHLAILLLCVLAFGCLALAMERHQENLLSRRLGSTPTAILRTAGWFVLCISLVSALYQPLWSVGLVAWFGYLSAGAALVFVALLLANRKMSGQAER